MRKKAIAAGVGFALISTMTLAQAAFAAPPEKQAENKQNTSHGPPPKKAKAASDVGQDHKASICHNGHIISVDVNALAAHGIDSIVEGESASTDENGSGGGRGHKKHADTLVGDAAIATEGEDVAEGACQGEPTQQPEEEETDEEAVVQEENEQSTPEGTTAASQEAGQDGQGDQAKEEVKTCDGESIELSEEEKLTLDLHNKTRKYIGLGQLCVDPTLQRAARAHSADMLKKHYFGHNSPDGKTSGKRLKESGYDWRATGENIAWGSGSYSKPKNRFVAWLKSEGHLKNILDKNFEEVGVGVVKGKLKNGSEEATFYTVDFGSKKKK